MKNENIDSIVIFTLNSFCSYGAVKLLIYHFNDRIAGIVLSDRYGGKNGSFFYQLRKNWQRSGFKFVNYLSFHLVYYHVAIFLLSTMTKVGFKKKKILSVKSLAAQHNIPIYSTKNINSSESILQIKKLQPKLIISCYFDQIIKNKIFSIPKFGAINIHPGVLPDNRGAFPVIASAIYGYKQGATVHKINEKIDEGAILVKKDYLSSKKNSIIFLEHNIMKNGARLAIESVEQMEDNCISQVIQEERGGNYHSFPTKDELKIMSKNGYKLYSYKDFFKTLIIS